MPRLHIALVTGRPEANLIPLLQLKPQQIFLIASDRMAEPADRLHTLLQEKLGDHSDIRVLKGLPDSGPEAISHYALDLVESLNKQKSRQENLEITYDLTGGTKLMALLFQEAMRHCDAKMLYVDSDAEAIYHMGAELNPDTFKHERIEPVLDAASYLLANGKRLRRALSHDDQWRDKVQARKTLTKHLGHRAESLAGLIGQLNYLIQVDQGDKRPVILQGNRKTGPTLNPAGWEQRLGNLPGSAWKAALGLMAEANLLEWSPSNPQLLRFPNLDGALFLSGGWLEEYAWHCACDAGLADASCGVQVTDETGRKNDVRNEFDLLAVHRNRMLIIECKTGRLDADGPDQQILHKLHSLADQSSGLFGTQLLLTAQQFGSKENRDTNLKRAEGMRINLMEGQNLKLLSERIRGWMISGRWAS